MFMVPPTKQARSSFLTRLWVKVNSEPQMSHLGLCKWGKNYTGLKVLWVCPQLEIMKPYTGSFGKNSILYYTQYILSRYPIHPSE